MPSQGDFGWHFQLEAVTRIAESCSSDTVSPSVAGPLASVGYGTSETANVLLPVRYLHQQQHTHPHKCSELPDRAQCHHRTFQEVLVTPNLTRSVPCMPSLYLSS